ncbi:ABC transporter ATP-binding protein [Pseudaeromonas sharmana]|uniref:ABC transporter ATP-binding protein n=1 Tax=Pseudaeromonas sharmana TaxID=328412 RepID=A0ABV8CS64_9GAMM
MSEPSMIVVKDLTQYVSLENETLTILQGINLEVKAAETVALIGRSGSGKSTLLGLLAGLDQPTQGDIELLGLSLKTLDEEARARLRAEQIGFIFQSFHLLPSLSALENVMLPAEIRGQPQARAQATALLAEVGLAHRLHHHPAQLSGGEQQRVAIARAFMGRPRLLLADEPTGNLDRQTGERIAELLFRLNREHGTALFIVTHDEQLAARCQRRLHLDGGQLSMNEPVGSQ